MITPRTTRLVRAPGLRAFQSAIARLAGEGGVAERRDRAVIVPTHAAGHELRRTIERREGCRARGGSSAMVFPDFVTRDDWYGRLHRQLADAPPLLSAFEREVLAGRAARDTAAAGVPPPFPLRPGLVVEMLALYDDLRRRHRTLDAFERLLAGSLESSAEIDRGAARLLAQTRFLAAAFRRYEQLAERSGRLDEHALRARLVVEAAPVPVRHVVVTVPDQHADRWGLWPADYDLLTRLPGLSRVDVVATEETLASGFLERVHDALPGITEERASNPPGDEGPVLLMPPDGEGRPYWRMRDREEELAEAVRWIRRSGSQPSESGDGDGGRAAIVVQRPLPYAYLARQVFESAGMPYQTFDALPLAGEPFAAALDLVLSVVSSGFTRGDLVALLRSPHFSFADAASPLSRRQVAELDRALQQERYLGDLAGLSALADRLDSARSVAAPAARAAARLAAELAPLATSDRPSAQLARLAGVIARYERVVEPADPGRERHLRARAAILGALHALARAYRDHDDAPCAFDEVAATLRRWIEGQTFAPRSGSTGPHLVDVVAARFGDFDDVRLLGLVEQDWPEAPRRNVFYPAWLLTQLGWAPDPDRLRGARAGFRDLLRLPAARLIVSAFTLEDDALVRPSPFLEAIEEVALQTDRVGPWIPPRIFAHEALIEDPVVPSALSGRAARWLALRLSPRAANTSRFRGSIGPRDRGVLRVSAVDRYLDCPFRYFAAHVLRLGEERDDEPGLSALERGLLVHDVFEEFFARWQRLGHGAITPANVSEALDEFARAAESRLSDLPDADRALERTRLLGSAVAAGFGSRAFEFEIENGAEITERLLEHPLDGQFHFQGRSAEGRVAVRGKADRIDLLADGTLRLVDYKLGRAPEIGRKIQLPVYGVCAEQSLRGYGGRDWTFGAAGYLAFGKSQPFASLATARRGFDETVSEALDRFLDAVDGIERGEYPITPTEPFLCSRCPYPSVCRKDYVGDE